MTDWTLHWLEAEGTLAPHQLAIEAEVVAARAAVTALLPPPRLDVLLQRIPRGGIPELGIGGSVYRRGLVTLTLDPDNPRFAPSLADGALRRTLVHEVHHALRIVTRRLGGTLGDAIVAEGLAGQFCRLALGNPPEPWEAAVAPADLRRHLPDRAAMDAPRYDHAAWFYGRGTLPRWIGYTLGYRLAGHWLDAAPRDMATVIGVPTAELLDVALPRLLGEP